MPTGVFVRTKPAWNKGLKSQLFCSVEGCNREHRANGLCLKHYQVEYSKQWRENNKDHAATYDKQYAQTLIGKASRKAARANRRALIKGLTKEVVQRVYEDNIKKFGTLTCVLCFKPIEFGDDSLEHLTPLTREGTNNYDNLGIAHLTCNIKKHSLTLEEWFKKQVLSDNSAKNLVASL